MGCTRIAIDIDERHIYASIDVRGLDRHWWVELNGSHWALKTGNTFDRAIKTWRFTANRQDIYDVIPDALAIILKTIRTSI
jgi:hypothetical protein